MAEWENATKKTKILREKNVEIQRGSRPIGTLSQIWVNKKKVAMERQGAGQSEGNQCRKKREIERRRAKKCCEKYRSRREEGPRAKAEEVIMSGESSALHISNKPPFARGDQRLSSRPRQDGSAREKDMTNDALTVVL